MFDLMEGKAHLWQWDTEQRLIVNNANIEEAHFSNMLSTCALVCAVYEENGQRLVNVPNVLLQACYDIKVYAVCEDCTMLEKVIKVYRRAKPDDYVYTETEVKTYTDLEKRLEEIEKNGVSQDVINAAVSGYFEENPIETGATAEQAAQIEANSAAIEEIQEDYALKTDIPTLEDYATKTYVDDAIPVYTSEKWYFTLEDGSTVEKEVVLK